MIQGCVFLFFRVYFPFANFLDQRCNPTHGNQSPLRTHAGFVTYYGMYHEVCTWSFPILGRKCVAIYKLIFSIRATFRFNQISLFFDAKKECNFSFKKKCTILISRISPYKSAYHFFDPKIFSIIFLIRLKMMKIISSYRKISSRTKIFL